MSPRLLLVDDDIWIREAFAQALADEGWVVETADNGRTALERLFDGEPPRLILLDLRMPVMSGWEFRARQLRVPRLAAIPVLVLSADRDAESAAAGLGAVECLRKPVDLARLLSSVGRHAA